MAEEKPKEEKTEEEPVENLPQPEDEVIKPPKETDTASEEVVTVEETTEVASTDDLPVKKEEPETTSIIEKEEPEKEDAPEPPEDKANDKVDTETLPEDTEEEKAVEPEQPDKEAKVEKAKPSAKKDVKKDIDPSDKTTTADEDEPSATEEEQPKEKARGPKRIIGLPPDKILLFGKYNMAEVVVHDPGLERYLNLDPIIVAHTGAKHANRSFGKKKLHIIERLVNNMMRTEEYTGKKTKAYSVVKKALGVIEKRTKTHPIQILVNALENSAPREEITRLRYGGISVPKAVDTSSSRRLDIAFRNISRGSVSASYKSAKKIEMCLANEIILASKKDMNSYAVSKKEEMERIAASAR